jgi:hypothetical protein
VDIASGTGGGGGAVTGGNGGPLDLVAGNGGVGSTTGGNGGATQLLAGAGATQAGNGGAMDVHAGDGATSNNSIGGSGGATAITAGDGGNNTAGVFAGGAGGALSAIAGDGGNSTNANGGAGGSVLIESGDGGDTPADAIGGAGGNLTLTARPGGDAAAGTGGAGGSVAINAGDAGAGGNANGGNIALTAGDRTGGGTDGDITFTVNGPNTTTYDGATGDWLMPARLKAGAAAITDANANADDGVFGDLATDNHGITVCTQRFARIGATNVSGALDNFFYLDCSGDKAIYYSNNNPRYHFEVLAFRPEGTMGRDLGTSSSFFQRTYSGHHVVGVLNVGDASSALDNEEYIIVEEPAAGNNDLTAPTGAIGWKYRIRISVARAGSVRFDTTGGDTVNGGAAPFTMVGAPTTYTVIKETASDWRVEIE